MTNGALTFPLLDFNRMNEADIQGEVIEPLLHYLGYRSGTECNIRREQQLVLRYPKGFLGRKKPSQDPELVGRPDYILDVKDLVRWVIEAKPPNSRITQDDVEQARTYATHPQVSAHYFSLCNGRRLVVYETSRPPQAEPLLEVTYEDFSRRYLDIARLLSAEALLQQFPKRREDVSPPLGLGLRSVARIASGSFRSDRVAPFIPGVNELRFEITGSSVARDQKNRMLALITTVATPQIFQEVNEHLGLSDFIMESSDNVLSTDPFRPTTFRYERMNIVPEGTEVALLTRQRAKLPMTLKIETSAVAVGHLEDYRFSGRFEATAKMPGFSLQIHGPFEIFLA